MTRAPGLWVLVLLCGWIFATAAGASQDVRVLVDISAGMKEHDAGGLRGGWTGALADRLPEGSQAGIWTFGRFVNLAVPWRTVDPGWREAARRAAADIPSLAVYRDLEVALDKATWNWQRAEPGVRRQLVLFTDGPVALPDGAEANRRSRERISARIVPRLRTAAATVHVVALSPAADEPVLRSLASATGGRFLMRPDPATLEGLTTHLLGTPPAGRAPDHAAAPTARTSTPAAIAPATVEPANVEAAPASGEVGSDKGDVSPATPTPPTADAMRAASGPDWTRIGLVIMAVNLLLGIATFLGWRWLERPRVRKRAPAVAKAAQQIPVKAPAKAAAKAGAPAPARAAAPAPEKAEDELPQEEVEAIAASVIASQATQISEAADDLEAMEARWSIGTEADKDPSADPLQGIDVSDIDLDFDDSRVRQTA